MKNNKQPDIPTLLAKDNKFYNFYIILNFKIIKKIGKKYPLKNNIIVEYNETKQYPIGCFYKDKMFEPTYYLDEKEAFLALDKFMANEIDYHKHKIKQLRKIKVL